MFLSKTLMSQANKNYFASHAGHNFHSGECLHILKRSLVVFMSTDLHRRVTRQNNILSRLNLEKIARHKADFEH